MTKFAEIGPLFWASPLLSYLTQSSKYLFVFIILNATTMLQKSGLVSNIRNKLDIWKRRLQKKKDLPHFRHDTENMPVSRVNWLPVLCLCLGICVVIMSYRSFSSRKALVAVTVSNDVGGTLFEMNKKKREVVQSLAVEIDSHAEMSLADRYASARRCIYFPRLKRGVTGALLDNYCTTSETPHTDLIVRFRCLDQTKSIPFTAVNDGYCDCEGDGSDEPGTSACAGITKGYTSFLCATRNMHPAPLIDFDGTRFLPNARPKPRKPNSMRNPANFIQRVPASMVDDGVCDCCDGSDETNPAVKCPNTC